MTDIEYLKKYLASNLEEGISKLKQGLPVQYIVGNVDFYGNKILVNPSVLIPRFETEELVNKTYNYLKHYDHVDIADIGTGSGCIAISLAKLLKASIDAVDISNEALIVAKENALNNKVTINFLQGNMLEPLTKKYDCLISNPPYISYDEEIMDIVLKNEPKLALYAPNNGLYFYEEILKEAHKYLKDKYLIAFEIGYKQAEAIKNIAIKYFPTAFITVLKDLQNKDRFLFISTL
ncbi:MAG: peptide chain release factor N(5)-glutamine methyltransferase [Bacilli bacterium]